MPSSNKCPMARRRNGAIFSAFAVLVVALLCAGQRTNNTEIMLARLQTSITLLWGNRAFQYTRRKGRMHGTAWQADRAMDDYNILRFGFQIIFFEGRCCIRFLAGSKTRAHLDASCAHFYHINDVLAMKDAASRYDWYFHCCTDIGDEVTYSRVRPQMSASFFSLKDDCRRTKTL